MTGLTLQPGAAAMQLRQALHQRQAKPRSAGLAVEAVVDLAEGLEDAGQLFGGNAGAVVIDAEFHAAGAADAAGDGDMAAGRGELGGIGNQVQQHLLERALVGHQQRQFRRHGDGEFLVPEGEAVGHDAANAFHDMAGIDRLGLDLHLAGLDLGDIEQIVDQRQQVRAGMMDVAGIFAVTVDDVASHRQVTDDI